MEMNQKVEWEKVISESCPTVFVGGFPKGATQASIQQFLYQINATGHVNLVHDVNGRSRGFAFITFQTMQEAQEFAQKEIFYDGKILDCKVSKDQKTTPTML